MLWVTNKIRNNLQLHFHGTLPPESGYPASRSTENPQIWGTLIFFFTGEFTHCFNQEPPNLLDLGFSQVRVRQERKKKYPNQCSGHRDPDTALEHTMHTLSSGMTETPTAKDQPISNQKGLQIKRKKPLSNLPTKTQSHSRITQLIQ
jgi:hypothetical protein